MNDRLIHIVKTTGTLPGTLLLVHGNSSSSKLYSKVFSSSGIQNQIIAFDFPGHGNSFHFDAPSSYTFERFTAEIVEIANSVGDDLVLVGHSLGGHMAIRASREIPRLKGLVICGTPPLASPPNFQDAFLAHPGVEVLFTAAPLQEKLERFIDSVCYAKQATKIILADFLRTDGKARVALLRELSESPSFNELETFNSLSCPRTIIRGSHDPLVSPGYLKTVASISGAQLVTITGCGHYIPAEQPERLNEILKRVCRETLDKA